MNGAEYATCRGTRSSAGHQPALDADRQPGTPGAYRNQEKAHDLQCTFCISQSLNSTTAFVPHLLCAAGHCFLLQLYPNLQSLRVCQCLSIAGAHRPSPTLDFVGVGLAGPVAHWRVLALQIVVRPGATQPGSPADWGVSNCRGPRPLPCNPRRRASATSERSQLHLRSAHSPARLITRLQARPAATEGCRSGIGVRCAGGGDVGGPGPARATGGGPAVGGGRHVGSGAAAPRSALGGARSLRAQAGRCRQPPPARGVRVCSECLLFALRFARYACAVLDNFQE